MRITASSFYNNIYGENNKINRQLFDVNKQISSGLKIQYAHDDPAIFVDTLRLDDEITTLSQIKNSSDNAYKFSDQTDTTIGQIVEKLEQTKVKLLYAANEIHSDTSLQAIAKELRGLQKNLVSLANSSIGGQYLFSGTATSVKPIDINGVYQGNDQPLEAFLGTGVKQKYNITGAQLFLGEEQVINRTVSTNIAQYSLTSMYPTVMQTTGDTSAQAVITGSSTIRDLMGDNDTDPANDAARSSYFYIQGRRTDGTAFKSTIEMGMGESVDDLMQKIALAYDPNQAAPLPNQVSVSLNSSGQIKVIDKLNGSSLLDFHMIGAVDYDGTDALVTDIDALQAGTTDFMTAVTTGQVYVKEFTRSGFTTPTGTLNTIEGINYDRTNFVQDGAKLISNASQIVKSDNSFATPSTRLGAVASGTTYDAINDRYAGLEGTVLNLEGTNIDGLEYRLQVNLAVPSTVTGTVGGAAITSFTIYDADTARTPTDAGKMTYQQLLDVVNMAVGGSLPAADTPAAYDAAITAANARSDTSLDYAGRIVFIDKTVTTTQASLSLYDNSSDTYPAADTTSNTGPALVFNANSALTVRDPKNDFFARLEEMIQSVEQGKYRSDGTDPIDPRNGGIQDAIQMIDDLSDHVTRMQTESGSYSQTLVAASERTEMLIISTKSLQSDVIDTDIAEATLRLQQLSLNYQALFSGIDRISKLSLVNYLS